MTTTGGGLNIKTLEWHDRHRDDRGRFLRGDPADRFNLRLHPDMMQEIRRRANEAQLSYNDYVRRCLLTAWAVYDEVGQAEQIRRLKHYAPQIYAASLFDANVSRLIEIYDHEPDERNMWRRRGFRVGDARRKPQGIKEGQ